MVGDSVRNRIAHITNTGEVSPLFSQNGFDASVNALKLNGTQLYVGGNFTATGEFKEYDALLNNTDGQPISMFTEPNGAVHASVSDGSGGWYIGGDFTMVGDSARNRIAHINNMRQVTAWNPNANNRVRSLAVSGSTVYAGGDFSTIGGQTKNRIAALDATTGLATAWNPNANNSVRSLAISGNTVYVGGLFATIGGQSRNRIAAL
jgi:hypothetical protein